MKRLLKKISKLYKNDSEECELLEKEKDYNPKILNHILYKEDISLQLEDADITKDLGLDDDTIRYALAGCSQAQLRIGKTYFRASHLENNCYNAFRWIQYSAEQGNMEAQFRLADLYALGQGIQKKDHSKAYEYYTKSALQGYKKALIRIHNHYCNDVMMHCRGQLYAKEEEWDNESFKIKNSIRELNEYRLEKKKLILNGAMEYYTAQFQKYQSIRDELDGNTLQNLAFLYEHGYGVKRYIKRAIELYKKAADLYCNDAKYNLGRLYQKTSSIKFHYRKAYACYLDAAKGGNVAAQNCLAYFYEKGLGTHTNSESALYWYTKAAQAGNSNAQLSLGRVYRRGKGDVAQDYLEAAKWYLLAAQQGNSVAQNCLDQLHQNGHIVSERYEVHNHEVEEEVLTESDFEAENDTDKEIEEETEEEVEEIQEEQADQKIDGEIDEEKTKEVENLKEDKDLYKTICFSQYSITPSKRKRLHSRLRLDISHLPDPENMNYLKILAKRALVGDGNGMYQIGIKYYIGEDFKQDQDIGVKWIQNAAKAELPEAKLKVAEMYAKGETMKQNYYKASIWCEKGVRKREKVAQYNLGRLYDKGLGVRRDPLEASKWFELSATQGNSDAQFELGLLRYHGRGLTQSNEEAIEWYTTSAIQGNVDAFYLLGQLHWNGIIVKEDKTKALKMYMYAARYGSSSAQYRLAVIYEQGVYIKRDLVKANFYRDESVASGNKNSQYKMACKYLKGKSVELDYIKAFDLFKKAADQNHYNAKHLFDVPIQHGRGIYNYNKVMEMFMAVSEQNIASLEFNIGYSYENGIENALKKDYRLAIKWYFNATKKEDPRAYFRLGLMYEEGRGRIKSLRAAIYYYKKACEKGERNAMYRLGCIFLDGRGTPQDVVMAFHLFTAAANMDQNDASKALLRSFENGDTLIGLEQDNDQSGENGDDSDNYLMDFSEGATPIQIGSKNQMLMLKTMAKEEGYIAVQYQLGMIFELTDDPNEAFVWYAMASKGGVTDAIYRLGSLYEDGRGVIQDYAKAIALYENAASRDHEEALYRLAQMYLYEKGVECDYFKAFSLFERAADLGHEPSYILLDITRDTKSKNENKPENNDDDDDDDDDDDEKDNDEHKFVILMCEHVAEYGNIKIQYKLGVFYERIAAEYLEAVRWYTMAADNEHEEARYRLGRMYEKGLGVEQDYNKSLELYNLAKEQGSNSAIYRLGTAYHYGYGVDIDPEIAIDCYTSAAELGHAGSQYALGRLYEYGELVEQDLTEALKWYTRSYLQGNANVIPSLYALYDDTPYESMFYQKLFQILSKFERSTKRNDESYSDIFGHMCFTLGTMYNYGLGVEEDEEAALKYFTRAYNKYEFAEAKDYITVDYDSENLVREDDIIKRLETYDMIRNDIGKVQQYQLGMVYYNGVTSTEETELSEVEGEEGDEITDSFIFHLSKKKKKRRNRDGRQIISPCPPTRQLTRSSSSFITIVPKNYLKARQYLTLSAEQGYLDAQAQLGDMYLHGHGVDEDRNKAIEWFKLSAEQMDKTDLNDLGKRYYDEADYEISFIYFKRAAEQGDREAQKYIGDMYRLGRGMENKNYYQAIQWYTKIATDLENNIAYYLGTIYHAGDNGIQHFSKALKWYKKMKIRNKGYSLRSIGLLYEHGDGVQQSYTLAYRYYKMASKYEPLGGFYNLGLLHFYGRGVPQDYGKAYKWFSRVMKRSKSPNDEVTHVFVRDGEEGKVYSLEKESVFHEETSHYLNILRASRKRNLLQPRNARHYARAHWPN